MFCDLVGSTPLSIRFDPRNCARSSTRTIVASPTPSAALVVLSLSIWATGVLIYFGIRRRMRTTPERAVRAGLAVIDAVGPLATQEPLNVRVGVAIGLVVVGDLIGAGAAQERGVVGRRQTSPPVCRRWPGRAPRQPLRGIAFGDHAASRPRRGA